MSKHLKHKYVFTKCYLTTWTIEVFAVQQVNSTVLWKHIKKLGGNVTEGTFYEQEL